MNFAYLCCMSSNSVTMPSKLLPISKEHGEMGIQVIGQYKDASRNSLLKIRALKMKKGRGRACSLTMNNCKQLLSKIHNKMPKKCLRFLSNTL